MENLNIPHSAFKDAYFITGNVSSPFQASNMIRSKIREGQYTHNPTLEQLVKFDLDSWGNLLPNHIKTYVRDNALNGISQTVYLIRSTKARDSMGKPQKYAFLVMSNKGEILKKIYLVNHYKAMNAVDKIAEIIKNKHKTSYEKFKAMGREHQILS